MTKTKTDDLDSLRKILDALDGFETTEQQRILRWTREKLGLATETGTPAAPAALAAAPLTLEGGERPPAARPSDIKTFIESKKPSSDNQFAAAVAYFHRFEVPEPMRKEAITKDDLLEACRQVGRNRFPRPDQTLVNAHGQGLLDRAEKGAYSINTVGENLVAVALPSEGGAGTARRGSARNKSPKRKQATKKTAGTKRAVGAKRKR